MPYTLQRYNGWLPSPEAYDAFVDDLVKRAAPRSRTQAEHVPPVKKFQESIQADPTMVELFRKVFLQSKSKVRSFDEMLHIFDSIVVAPPRFIQYPGGSEPVGVPMLIVFDLLSNCSAAYDLFRMSSFNEPLKELLDDWGKYLVTNDSNKTLTDEPDGWFSEAAMKVLEEGRGVFNETYVVLDDTAVNRGYKSWDAFFVRQIQPKARPIVPGPDTIIYNACESTVIGYVPNVQAHDLFWLKGMPYSLYDIFNCNNDTAKQFIGGTVYQAFLSPQDYHRWHSPVTGTVREAYIVPGTYYAVLPDNGENDDGDLRGALIRSQPWLTLSSARAIIIIDADDPKIGRMAFIGVGMAEVSTCQLLVQSGQRVEPGNEIGMFHFGGSTHALIFGPQAKLTFERDVVKDRHLHVNRIIASADQ